MIVIYLRTSTEEQDPQNQLNDCLKIAGDNPEVFEEKQSAWKDKDRVVFKSICNKIKQKVITDLYVWDWDRLFRNQKKLVEFFKFCELYNCKIHSFNQQYFEDFYKIPKPFDEIVSNLVLNLMGWLSEEESKKKSNRVKIAFQNHKGKKWGRKPISQKVKDEIIEAHKRGLSIREISDSVFIWDTSNNRKNISKSLVHKTIQIFNSNNQSYKGVSNKGTIKI